MHKRPGRALSLHRETLRELNSEALAQAGGGFVSVDDNTCPFVFGLVSQALLGNCISVKIELSCGCFT